MALKFRYRKAFFSYRTFNQSRTELQQSVAKKPVNRIKLAAVNIATIKNCVRASRPRLVAMLVILPDVLDVGR
jgi:hypothetical protein